MNVFLQRILFWYNKYISQPYRDMDDQMKRCSWLLIVLLASFTTLSLKPSLLNRPLGLKSI